jgi:hypothetical protein
MCAAPAVMMDTQSLDYNIAAAPYTTSSRQNSLLPPLLLLLLPALDPPGLP